MSESPSFVFVGESNPYGSDPYFALYDEPENSSGARLRRILGLSSSDYRALPRVNLCRGEFSLPMARLTADRMANQYRTFVLLGRKVARAFRRDDSTSFSIIGDGVRCYVLLPHPSGLCREWSRPGAVEDARMLLRRACPSVAWGGVS